MPNRFDYVAYDAIATDAQAQLKAAFQKVELLADMALKSPRAKALVMTKLEEAYMWVGKAIRDDQVERNGAATLQEQRNNG